MSTDKKASILDFLNRLVQRQQPEKELTIIPSSIRRFMDIFGFYNWPYNKGKWGYTKEARLDRRAAMQIWEAALQKSITPSVKPEDQLRFLLFTLGCLQTLREESEDTRREIKLGDNLFSDPVDQSSVES